MCGLCQILLCMISVIYLRILQLLDFKTFQEFHNCRLKLSIRPKLYALDKHASCFIICPQNFYYPVAIALVWCMVLLFYYARDKGVTKIATMHQLAITSVKLLSLSEVLMRLALKSRGALRSPPCTHLIGVTT